jgi:hypothetical protein
MLFGFVCYCRSNPNNPDLFHALGVEKAEGVKVDSVDYVFMRTASAVMMPDEKILTTLASFGFRPIRSAKDAPELITLATSTRAQRQTFFRHIKFHRMRYARGMETSYWYWLQPPLDTKGNPLPPPAGAYEIDPTPSSRWRQYWDRCPGGDYCTQAILD